MTAAQSTPAVPRVGDAELMRRIESGSIVAFEELYDLYSARAYRVARSVCREGANAEEAVQEAFLSVWKRGSRYRPERGSVAAWLLTAVRFRAIDAMRRDRAHVTHRPAADLIDSPVGKIDSAEKVAENNEAAHVRALLKRIPEAQREVITLAFYGQLTHVEIATHLQLPTGTIKGRMRLGLEKLRAQVEQEDNQY